MISASEATPSQSALQIGDGVKNVILRALTLCSRLALTVLVAKVLTPAEVGYYGAVAGGLAIAVILLGAEFYQHTFRAVAGASPKEQQAKVKSQARFHSVAWMGVIALATVCWGLGLAPVGAWLWLVPLLLADHLCQELARLLISLGLSTRANLVQLCRQGVWAPALAVWWILSDVRSLQQVWVAWLAGCILAAILGMSALSRHWGGLRVDSPVDWSWIQAGLPVALKYTFVVVCITAVPLVGRYALLGLVDSATAGRFMIAATMTNPIQTLAEAGVVAVLYPRLLAARNRADERDFEMIWSILWRRLMVTVLSLTVVVGVAACVVQAFVLNDRTAETALTTLILAVASGTLACASIPQMLLFSQRRDAAIVVCAVLSLLFTVVASWLLVPPMGVVGAALGTAVGAVTLLLTRGAMLSWHTSARTAS